MRGEVAPHGSSPRLRTPFPRFRNLGGSPDRPHRQRLVTLLRFAAILGPGIIVANAGNDAGGIFTYSNIGAKYGYALLWTFLPITVALIVVQEMVGRLGCVTGKGLMDLIRERFGVRWTVLVSLVVLVANGGTLLAEFAGAAGALGLLGVSRPVAIITAALAMTVLILRANRTVIERVFLAMGLAFISYFITAFLVPTDWREVGASFVGFSLAHGSVPSFVFTSDIIALIGTTITPYMQLYLQSSIVDKGSHVKDLRFVQTDVISGALFSNVVAIFIVITTAATLFSHGLAGIGVTSAQSAANALTPLAGVHARDLFAIGLLGASLLAAGVLPISTAFVICEAFGAERSVEKSFKDARLFFTIFIGLIVIAAGIMLIPSLPIAGVAIGTQTLDGLLLPILLVFVYLLANDQKLLGSHANTFVYKALAGLTVVALVGLDACLLYFSF